MTSKTSTEQIITDYIKEQCHRDNINNALIILPETVNVEILKTSDTIDIQHYRQLTDTHNKIQCLHIKVKNLDNNNDDDNDEFGEEKEKEKEIGRVLSKEMCERKVCAEQNNIVGEVSSTQVIQGNDDLDIHRSIREYCQLLNNVIDSKNDKWDWANKVFLSSLSHQIKTPLTGILAGIDILDTLHKNIPESQSIIKHLYQSCVELSSYIGEITAYYVLKQKKIKLNLQWVLLNTLLKEIDDLFQLDLTEKHIKYQWVMRDGVRNYAYFIDYEKIIQVMNKLIKNSIQFSKNGQICVYIQLSSDEEKLNFSVMDTGRTIPINERHKIFQPFYQVNEQWMTSQEGLGLGLAICKELITVMEGDIYIGNTTHVDIKTVIEFFIQIKDKRRIDTPIQKKSKKRTLPHIPALLNTSVSNQRDQGSQGTLKGKGNDSHINTIKNVLIVEDNQINSNLISLMVSKVIPHPSVIKQLHQSEKAVDDIMNHDYQLILLDLKMPHFSGFDILTSLKNKGYLNNEKNKGKIIIITALLHHDIEEVLDQYTNINILYKPIKLQQLKETIYHG